MVRLLTDIYTTDKDYFHMMGQFLLSPLSIVFGRSYKIEGSNVETLAGGLVRSPTIAKISAFAVIIFSQVITALTVEPGHTASRAVARLCILVAPLALGAILKLCSKSHKVGYELIKK